MEVVIAVIVSLTIGILIGMITTMIRLHIHSTGVLRVDHSIPEDGPRLFLELSESVDSIARKKYVTLAVNDRNYIR